MWPFVLEIQMLGTPRFQKACPFLLEAVNSERQEVVVAGGGPLVVQVVWGGRRRDQHVTLLESAGRITSITVLHISVITLL